MPLTQMKEAWRLPLRRSLILRRTTQDDIAFDAFVLLSLDFEVYSHCGDILWSAENLVTVTVTSSSRWF